MEIAKENFLDSYLRSMLDLAKSYEVAVLTKNLARTKQLLSFALSRVTIFAKTRAHFLPAYFFRLFITLRVVCESFSRLTFFKVHRHG